MFCITLAETSYKKLLAKIKRGAKYTDFFEIRADYLEELNTSDLKKILELPYKFLFTLRSYEEGGYKKLSDEFRLKWISWALKQNFYLVDLEWRFFKKFSLELKDLDLNRVLFSYHNFKKTPSENFLKKLILEMKKRKIKKAKIVCLCKNFEDFFKLLNLIFLAKKMGMELISFGMGEKGKLSRILSLFCGSPFTYVVLSRKEAIAPGQFDIKSAMRVYHNLKKIMGE